MLKQSKAYLIITALLLVILGILCIINPGAGIFSMAWLIGLLILISGCSTLIFGLRMQAVLPNSGSTTLLAIFQIVIGLIFLFNGVLAAGTLIVVFSLWVMFEGISLSVLSVDYKRAGYSRWWCMLLLGLCSMVLGFVAMCNPETTGIFLGILIGLGIIANGIVRLVAFSAIKRIENRVQDVKDKLHSVNIDSLNQDNQ